MLNGIKKFIDKSYKIIKKENRKSYALHKEIEEYETLICIIGQSEVSGRVVYYKEKISQCYAQIDICLENINSSKDRIATMKMVDNIIKRGEKSA